MRRTGRTFAYCWKARLMGISRPQRETWSGTPGKPTAPRKIASWFRIRVSPSSGIIRPSARYCSQLQGKWSQRKDSSNFLPTASRTRMPSGMTSLPIPSPGIRRSGVLPSPSPEAECLPPESAEPDPYDDVDDANEEAHAPPGSYFHVARAEKNGRGTCPIVRHPREEVAEKGEDEGREDRRRPRRDGYAEEGGVHGCHVRRVAGCLLYTSPSPRDGL